MFALCRRGIYHANFVLFCPAERECHRLNKRHQCQLLLLFCVHSLQLMPSSAHERIDRLARHLSASGAGATTRSVVSSPMAAQLTSHTRPPITSHALDTSTGKPARGLPLKLEQLGGAVVGSWLALGVTTTDEDGRAPGLLVPGTELVKGTYRVTFDTEAYFRSTGAPCFYPEVAVMFRVEDPSEHFHIPLLLSPFGYSTYRGS